MEKMPSSFGHGKTILIGEHFVVHGAPAVVLGLDRKIHVSVEKSEKDEILNKNWDDEKTREALKRAKKLLGVEGPVRVFVKEEFPPGAGLGGSAAFSVALIRALAKLKGVKLSKEEEWKYAHELEKVYHGTPSGIDTSAAVFGGFVQFEKGKKPVPLEKNLDAFLVLVHAGERERSVKELVESVRKIKEKNSEHYERIHNEYIRLYHEFMDALERKDKRKIGAIMDRVHDLLSKLGVSSGKIERVRKEAKTFGALGAKLTGAGDGGFVMALFGDRESSENFAKSAEKKYKHVVTVSI